MNSSRKEATPPARYLVATRPETSAEAAQGMARTLGLPVESLRDVLGGGWPRIVASRSTLAEAESLARVLNARGREAIAWDREAPLLELFQAERVLVEGGQLILEQGSLARRTYPVEMVQRVVDLRLRPGAPPATEGSWLRARGPSTVGRGEFPDRALLIVPSPGWGQPGVFSTRTFATGSLAKPPLVAAQLLQEAAVRVRAAVPERWLEIRTVPTAVGMDGSEREPLALVLQLFARLPPTPGPPGSGR